jgi:predicted dehydrogenase
MSPFISRRFFLQASAAAVAASRSSLAADTAAKSANETITLGVMGLHRGLALATALTTIPGAEVAYLCDVDSRALAAGLEAVSHKQTRAPKAVGDFRKILDDKSIDALVVAAPDHWHAPATILACDAGKHVYVEKPCSHNPREGELAIAAARRTKRVVQVGTQRRSWPAVIEAMDKLHAGDIGRVLYARAWYNNTRKSIGVGRPAPVPDWLDYSLWQGPAPAREYKSNLLPYNWHWFWHWGTGELGNNGVHALDLCRWGLGVVFPKRVVSGGGKYRHDDDQETPDTQTATFDFGDKSILWEGLSWSPRGLEGETFGASFHGDRGTMVITGSGYKNYDMADKEIASSSGPVGEAVHLQNFLDNIRSSGRPHADIEAGHRSTLLCHLGNIAYRVGRELNCDPKSGQIQNDPDAMRLWSREYRPGWEPKQAS